MQLRRLLLPLVAAVTAMGQTSTTPTTRSSSLPPVGLASSETAQVSVVNLANASSSGTAASCTGSISFVNAAGATVGAASTFTVTSGQTFSKPLPYSTTAASGRTVVRGVVSLTIPATSAPPCSLSIVLETFDTATGVTHVYQPSGSIEGGHRR
jgi:hypothetical protein